VSTTHGSTSGVAALLCLTIVAVGCTDEPVAPTPSPAPEAAVSASGRSDRHIVVMKEGVVSTAAAAVGTAVVTLGGRIERTHSQIGVLVVRGLNDAAAARLASRPDVEALARDRAIKWLPPGERFRLVRRRSVSSQSDQRDAAFFPLQWNIRRIRADDAWRVTNQGRGVTVCILDTGVDPRHIDLLGKLDFSRSASFVGGERGIRDNNLHGTAMASFVTTNGLGIASVAPDARLCAIKVLDRSGTGTFGDVIAGILYAAFVGADVASMSLGADIPPNAPGAQALIRATQRAINSATRQGVLFVASAGNAGRNTNTSNLIHIPAQLDNVISVGATGPINQRNFDRIASYSNRGRRGVDVFAPGGDLVPPNGVLEDLVLSACSPSNLVPGFEPCRSRDGYIFGGGTSQATAHVSGQAAVIESELGGNQSPARLTECILKSADPLPNPRLTANGRINVLRGARCQAAPKSQVVASN
jgi:lantibiotic leader peptide-processing serine protease